MTRFPATFEHQNDSTGILARSLAGILGELAVRPLDRYQRELQVRPMNQDQIADSIKKTNRQLRINWYEEQMVKATKQLVSLLRQLRDDPLEPWKATHETLEDYLRERWGISIRRQQQLLAAEDTRLLIADAAPDLEPVLNVMPESQMRVLVQTPPDRRVEVLRKAIELGGKKDGRSKAVPSPTIKRAKAIVIDGETGEPEKPTCCPTCKRPLP